jgi:hypothetical protein
MTRSYILDKNNTPIPVDDVIDAALWCEANPERMIVKQEMVGEYFVSTVFLRGIDHNWMGGGKPLLWETMVFGPKGNELFQDRYISYANALAGHVETVERLKRRGKDFNQDESEGDHSSHPGGSELG